MPHRFLAALLDLESSFQPFEDHLWDILDKLDKADEELEGLDRRLQSLDTKIDALMVREHDESSEYAEDEFEGKDLEELVELRGTLIRKKAQAVSDRKALREEFSHLYEEAKNAQGIVKNLLNSVSSLVTRCGFHATDFLTHSPASHGSTRAARVAREKQTELPNGSGKGAVSPASSAESASPDGDADLLNSKQVGILLNLGPDEVVELARKNLIPGKKHGKIWKFRRSDIEEVQKKLKL